MMEVLAVMACKIKETEAISMLEHAIARYKAKPTKESMVFISGVCAIVALIPGAKEMGIKATLDVIEESNEGNALMDRIKGRTS